MVVVVEDSVADPCISNDECPFSLSLCIAALGFITATGVVVVVVSSSKDVTTELVIVSMVATPAEEDVLDAGEMLFFCRTQASTFSLKSTGYVEHRTVASRSKIDCVARSAPGRCCSTKSKAN